MIQDNGPRWLIGMTETLVAMLLFAAVSGSVWSAIEIRAVGGKIEDMVKRQDRFERRMEEIQRSVVRLESRIGDQESRKR